MRLIDKILGKQQTNNETVSATAPENNPRLTLPRESVFSGSPTRILKNASDAKKDDALLDMSQVIAEIEKNPTANWHKYKGDFEKAVTGMKEAFDASPALDHVQVEALSKESMRQTLTDSGWKLSRQDEHALSVYEKHCNENSMAANPHDAGDWLKEFRRLNEEQRVDRLDAQKRSDQGYDVER